MARTSEGSSSTAGATPARSDLSIPSVFVGRTDELHRLGQLWRAAETPLVAIIGERGVGKSSVLASFLATVHRPVRVTRPRPSAQPYAWWYDLVGNTAISLPQVDDLGGSEQPGVVEAGMGDHLRLQRSLADEVHQLVADGVTLAVDDLHLAGPETLQVLADVLADYPVGAPPILATCVDAESGLGVAGSEVQAMTANAGQVTVLPLSAQESGSVVRGHLGVVTDGLIDDLYALSGGNPFHLTELLYGLGRSQMDGSLPTSVQSLVVERHAALPEPAARAVEALVVLGGEAPLALVLATAQVELADIDVAIGAGFCEREPSGIRTRHGLTTAAVHAAIPPHRYRDLHRRAATALDAAGGGPSRIAWHLTEADDHAAAAEFHVVAAARAQEAFDWSAAADHLRAAIHGRRETTAESPPVAELTLALADVLRSGGHQAEAADVLADFAGDSDNPDILARAAAAMPPGLEGIETIPHADARQIALCERALTMALPTPQRVRVQVALARGLYWAHHLDLVGDGPDRLAARRDRLTNDALAEARRSDDSQLYGEALLGRLYACWDPDHLGERSSLVGELWEVARQTGSLEIEVRAREWRVLGLLADGGGVQLDAELATYRAIAEEANHPWWIRRHELWSATRDLASGRISQAVNRNARAINRTAHLVGSEFAFQNAAITSGIGAYFQGGVADFRDAIRMIIETSPRVKLNWINALAFVEAVTGETEEARSLIGALLADPATMIPRDHNWLTSVQLLAMTAAEVGTAPEAKRLHDILLPYRDLDGIHGSGYATFGPIARILGRLADIAGDRAAARTHYEHVFRTRQSGPYYLLAQLHYAELVAADDPVAASQVLTDAERDLQEAGMSPWIAVARQLQTTLDEILSGSHRPLAVRSGRGWQLRHPAGAAALPDGKGVRVLLELLRRPGEPLTAEYLDSVGRGRSTTPQAVQRWDPASTLAPASRWDAPDLDPHGRALLTRRLDTIRSQLNRRRMVARREDLEAEAAEIIRFLETNSPRPRLSADADRTRVRVTKLVRRTVARIADQSPALATRLDRAITTGSTLVYTPLDGSGWVVKYDRIQPAS